MPQVCTLAPCTIDLVATMVVFGTDFLVCLLSPGEVQGSLEEPLIFSLLRESGKHCVKGDLQTKRGLAMLF